MEYDIEAILDMYEDDYTPDPRSTVPGPRPMKLAELPRHEWDNMNTPNLEQTPDSVLQPGQTLEDDFDVSFRKANADGGRTNFRGGGLAKVWMLLKNLNKTGAVRGLEEKLIKKFKATGMEFIEAVDKAHTQAAGVRYEAKMKIINDAMKEANVHSDDYVELLDMKIRIEDPEFGKQFATFPENLKNKARSRHDSNWAEANFGEEYGTKLDQARSRELNESIDPNFKEPLSPSDQMASNIDDMNIANTEEFFGRKKNSEGGVQQLVSNTDDGSRPGYKGENSKIYNESTGHIYPKSNRFGTVYSKTPTLNQHKVNLKDPKYTNEVIKFIDENPTFNQKQGAEILGKQRAELVNHKLWGNPGKKWNDEKTKLRNEANKAWTKKYSNISIEDKTRGDMDIHRQHAGALREKVGTENTMFLESKKNTTEIRPFEKAIDEIQLKQYQNNLNRSLPISKKKLVFEALEKEEAALRAANPEFSKYKSSLVFEESSLSKTGYKYKEVMSNPELTISEGKTGQKFTYKNVKPSSIEGKKIIELSNQSLEAKIKELGGKEKLNQILFQGGGTTAEKGLIQKIISGGGKFALSMLNPAELIKMKNLIGPGALGIMAAYEAGSITDDVLRLNKPLDEALAGNWLTKSFLPYSEEFAKQKNLLQSGKLTGSEREYALEMMKMEEFMKEGKRIQSLENIENQVGGQLGEEFTFTSQEDMNKAYKGLFGRLSRMKDFAYEEGITGRSLENEAARNELEDARLAKTGEYKSAVSEDKLRLPGQRQIKRDENYEFASSPIFGGPQRLVNKAPRPKNMTRGPMTEKGKMPLDFSIPGYTPYDKAYTPSNDEILQIYRNMGRVPPTTGYLTPGEGTRVRMDLAAQDGNRSIFGSKFAVGGLAGLMKKNNDKK